LLQAAIAYRMSTLKRQQAAALSAEQNPSIFNGTAILSISGPLDL
jgi:hypothetical protein